MSNVPKPTRRPLPPIKEQSSTELTPSSTEARKNEMSKLEFTIREMEKEILALNRQSTETDPDEHVYSTLDEVKKDLITQEVDLLLIGKTGSGKSAVGNTILGYNAFISDTSLESVTNNAEYDVGDWKGYKFKVVDSPGVADTRKDTKEATEFILKAMSEAITLSPHALLFVIRYGGRFTAEDKLTVDTLKKIFGEHFFKMFCILVMTCGDQFELENTTDFQGWVKKQNKEVFNELLKECNGRIVLIDNITTNEKKKEQKLIELVHVIDTLKWQNCRYSDEHFSAALQTRNELLLESQKEFYEKEIMDEAKVIQQRLCHILSEEEIPRSKSKLQNLYTEAMELYKRIEQIDQQKGVLKTFIHNVWSIMKAIRDQIKLSEHMSNETNIMKREREEQAIRHAKELRLQREAFDNLVLEGKIKEEVKLQMLQKQIDELNEAKKQWEEEDRKFNRDAKDKWDSEKEKVQAFEVDFNKLNTKTLRLADKKISRSVLAKLRDKFFAKRTSSFRR